MAVCIVTKFGPGVNEIVLEIAVAGGARRRQSSDVIRKKYESSIERKAHL
jgi:hypothetical protein